MELVRFEHCAVTHLKLTGHNEPLIHSQTGNPLLPRPYPPVAVPRCDMPSLYGYYYTHIARIDMQEKFTHLLKSLPNTYVHSEEFRELKIHPTFFAISGKFG